MKLRTMFAALIALACVPLAVEPASAQNTTALTVTTCGTQSNTVGQAAAISQDATGQHCVKDVAAIAAIQATGTVIGAPNITLTDCSGTIATGGTAQNAIATQTTLHGLTIANIDTSEVLWISFTGTAAASGTGSYPLAAAAATTFAGMGSFTSPMGMGTNHALSVVAATSTHKYSCVWW